MTSLAVTQYAKMAKTDEGWVPKVYKDYKGLPTLGYGHLVTEASQQSLTELGISKSRAQRILKGNGQMTPSEGERLLMKNIGRKEKEVKFMLGKQRYNKLSTNQKVAMLGLRFRGDFAKYNNPQKKILSKEYKHAISGRYNLAAKTMQQRVKNTPIGVRKRVERHSRPLLRTKPNKKRILATAAMATALGALAVRQITKQITKEMTVSKNKPNSLVSHAITNTPKIKVSKNRPKSLVSHAITNTPKRKLKQASIHINKRTPLSKKKYMMSKLRTRKFK